MTKSLFEGAHLTADPIESAFLAGAIAALRRRAARQARIAVDGRQGGESAVALRIAQALKELADELERGER
jgi:L-alanine-DL-glutamate epimerase-like enolase superfamily enzyme